MVAVYQWGFDSLVLALGGLVLAANQFGTGDLNVSVNGRMPDEFLRFELDRYLGWPGQAPSYKVGERIWLQAREESRRRLGDAFDLRSFHTAAPFAHEPSTRRVRACERSGRARERARRATRHG